MVGKPFFNISTSRLLLHKLQNDLALRCLLCLHQPDLQLLHRHFPPQLEHVFVALLSFLQLKNHAHKSIWQVTVDLAVVVQDIVVIFGCCYILYSKWIQLPKFLFQQSLLPYSGRLSFLKFVPNVPMYKINALKPREVCELPIELLWFNYSGSNATVLSTNFRVNKLKIFF